MMAFTSLPFGTADKEVEHLFKKSLPLPTKQTTND
jgi:hypothetical protein